VGKIPIDLQSMSIQFLSLSGHKLHAPKGVGALYVNRRTRFNPFLIGGSQENKRRGGTENAASIVALGKAAELAIAHLREEETRVKDLRDRFEQQVMERVSGVQLNGHPEKRLPNTVNLAFEGTDSEALLMLLDQRGVCCSAGSACTAGALEPSHVLRAMGFSTDRARSSLRFSFSRLNTDEEVELAADILTVAVDKVRKASRSVVTVGG